MKMLVAGVQRMAGISKAGSPFDMCNLHGLTQVEVVQGKFNKSGAGYTEMQLPLDPMALSQFMAYADKFPLVLDLETEPRPRMGKVETVVVGIIKVKA